MNKEFTMMDLIIETHSGLERQGPGSPEMVIKALSFIDNHKEFVKILDLACGSGGQTMVLAQNITGNKTIEAYIKEDKYEMELFSKYKQYYF